MKDRYVFEIKDGSCEENVCDLEQNGACFNIVSKCKIGHHYKLVKEEQVKIQTEYEWKKERYRLLCDTTIPLSDDQIEEFKNLPIWIRANKPTNWQTCTRKNTKAGDIVKNKVDEKVNYVIEQIYRETDNCTVWNIEVEKTTVNYVLSEFHIDLNNTEGK